MHGVLKIQNMAITYTVGTAKHGVVLAQPS